MMKIWPIGYMLLIQSLAVESHGSAPPFYECLEQDKRAAWCGKWVGTGQQTFKYQVQKAGVLRSDGLYQCDRVTDVTDYLCCTSALNPRPVKGVKDAFTASPIEVNKACTPPSTTTVKKTN
ncbi:hypothetical protein PGTUg99_036602 [Puccinia graminis f. sp. tritici]|uniref:Secreted protein n=1 Tax=Puccinia graminis f. sp. tritici TaxID=56615 RepID=A0A5B0SR25_PUCGR|nr:hypothetical protein PGTUg99_036602 [Puccinia graminis f. sp. tritici]